MSQDARDLLEALRGYDTSPVAAPANEDRPVKLGTVDAGYTGVGNPLVTFDGETTTGVRQYVALAPVAPGDRVVMLPVGHTYVILGAVTGGGQKSIRTTFTNVSSVVIDGLVGYDEYEFVLDSRGVTVASSLIVRLRLNGVTQSTTIYDDNQAFGPSSATAGALERVDGTGWALAPNNTTRLDKWLNLSLMRLNETERTRFLAIEGASNDTTAPNAGVHAGRHDSAAAYNGIEFAFSAPVTGIIVTKKGRWG